MGIVVDIKGDIITIKFADNTKRKYLRENFIIEPCIGQKVNINSDGTIIEFSKSKPKNDVSWIVIVAVVIGIIIVGNLISLAVEIGELGRDGCNTCVDSARSCE